MLDNWDRCAWTTRTAIRPWHGVHDDAQSISAAQLLTRLQSAFLSGAGSVRMITAHHLAQDIYQLATRPQYSLVVHFSYHPVLNGVGGRLHHLQVSDRHAAMCGCRHRSLLLVSPTA